MDNFIPYEKLSKKKKKEHNSKYRNDWGDISPVTRSIENGKKYKRNPKHRNKELEYAEDLD